jgi:hypothetical protein
MITTRRNRVRPRCGSAAAARDKVRDLQAGFGTHVLGGVPLEILASYWAAFSRELTEEWIASDPGTRPFFWWFARKIETPPWDEQFARLRRLRQVSPAEIAARREEQRRFDRYRRSLPRIDPPARGEEITPSKPAPAAIAQRKPVEPSPVKPVDVIPKPSPPPPPPPVLTGTPEFLALLNKFRTHHQARIS